jgi:hypothetical protein
MFIEADRPQQLPPDFFKGSAMIFLRRLWKIVAINES